jgi:hypothetical protein
MAFRPPPLVAQPGLEGPPISQTRQGIDRREVAKTIDLAGEDLAKNQEHDRRGDKDVPVGQAICELERD